MVTDKSAERIDVWNVSKVSGVAGQVAVSVTVRRPGEEPYAATFVGSVYGSPGPVVMVTDVWGQVQVTDPGRFGDTFGTDWVRAFYGAAGAQ